MNSWEIIKGHLTQPYYKGGTFGRLMQINNASDLFIELRDNLTDSKEALDLFNADPEVTEALCSRGLEKELRDVGVIR